MASHAITPPAIRIVTLAYLVQIFYLSLMQLFPNHTQNHVITPTKVCVFKQTPHFPLNHHHNWSSTRPKESPGSSTQGYWSHKQTPEDFKNIHMYKKTSK